MLGPSSDVLISREILLLLSFQLDHLKSKASLTALNKKTGGIRPIAVGCVWRRLSAKVVVHRITPQLRDLFSPHQLGVGVKGGAEAGAHAARRYWTSFHSSPRAFLKLDFRNAFNEVYRDNVLRQVVTHLPQYYKFVSSAYANPSHLYFNNRRILSQRGVQQEDPLGPALFALAIHPIVTSIITEFNILYLDDGTIADSPATVLTAYQNIMRLSSEVGLTLNEAKCKVGVVGGGEE